jgi:ketosteroid isomerase-like protein
VVSEALCSVSGSTPSRDTAQAMSQENMEIVRQIYAQWETGDMEAGVDRFDPDVVFKTFMPDSSERVVLHGPDEIRSFMEEFLANWHNFRIVGDDFRELENDSICVAGSQSATGRSSGATVKDSLFSVWTFAGEKVIRLVFDRDEADALKAVGLSE